MRLNAATALAKKPLVKKATKTFATCGEELAAAFTASPRFGDGKEKFFAQGFKLGRDGLQYEDLGRDDEYSGYNGHFYFRFENFGDNCGILIVCELDEIPADPAIQAAVMRAVACAARNGRYGMLLASVNHKQKQCRAMLEAFGMTPLMTTPNPNSSNQITLFAKDISKLKDTLGMGNGTYDESARSWTQYD